MGGEEEGRISLCGFSWFPGGEEDNLRSRGTVSGREKSKRKKSVDKKRKKKKKKTM